MATLIEVLGGVLVVLVVAVVGAYVVSLYNRLVRVDERVDNAWADIDVLLKQRQDAIEKLVDTAQRAMEFEQDLLSAVVEARERARRAETPEEQAAAGQAIRQALGRLNVRAEDHPEPQAVRNLQSLQDEIARIEEQIADRREVYNESVTAHNQLIRQIPYTLVAGPLGFERHELYDPPEAETADVDVGRMFSDAGGPEEATGS
ncbi:MAG: LemA family protein [Haloarculaceae archaeon]